MVANKTFIQLTFHPSGGHQSLHFSLTKELTMICKFGVRMVGKDQLLLHIGNYRAIPNIFWMLKETVLSRK